MALTGCLSEEDVTVSLINAIRSIASICVKRLNLSSVAVCEALIELASDENLPQLVSLGASAAVKKLGVMGTPIDKLPLSCRARNCLASIGVETLYDLVQRSADDLLMEHNFGMVILREIRNELTKHGLKLRGD